MIENIDLTLKTLRDCKHIDSQLGFKEPPRVGKKRNNLLQGVGQRPCFDTITLWAHHCKTIDWSSRNGLQPFLFCRCVYIVPFVLCTPLLIPFAQWHLHLIVMIC
jgi:hypothetical protein